MSIADKIIEFFEKRRILIIPAVILIVGMVGVFVYLTFWQPISSGPANQNVNGGTNGTLPNVNALTNRPVVTNQNVNAGLPVINVNERAIVPQPTANGDYTLTTSLSDDNAQSATLAADGQNLLYYNPADQKFYKLSADGKTKELLSDQAFYGVDKINWSNDKNKAILQYPDGTNILYDFANKKQTTLPREWNDFSFSPTGDRIAFKDLPANVDNRWLAVAKADGTEVSYLEPVGDKAADVQVAWSPNNEVAALYREGVDLDRQEIFLIGFHDENFKSIVTDGRGFEAKYTPKGDKLLYSVYNPNSNYNPELWVIGGQGEGIGSNPKDLGIQTWTNKCTFGSDNYSLYCAVPVSLEEGSGLVPDLAANVPDIFYKIDIKTGQKSRLAIPVSSDGITEFNAVNPFLSSDGSYLYFTDKNTGRLNKIKIK